MNAILNKSNQNPIKNITFDNRANAAMKDFDKVTHELATNLKHAFRYGNSAFRFGLMPQGISDHLPIILNTSLEKTQLKMMSWNLLADEHLFNNFINISSSKLLEIMIDNKLEDIDNIYQGAMYHLFAELAQYLYPIAEKNDNQITINKSLLHGFIPNASQPSRLARSRTPEVAKQKEEQVKMAREALVDTLLNTSDPNYQEYQIAIKQSLELIYHIKNPNGALRWQNRFERFKENKQAMSEFLSQDIIALQECSNPADIENLFQQAKKNMEVLSYNVTNSISSTDNCLLAFNKDKFSLIESTAPINPILTHFENKKPAIYCKLLDKAIKQEFIVASIHHPGGDHDLRHKIVENISQLQAGNTEMPFFIAGDYNHTQQQFLELSQQENNMLPKLYYPTQQGTMSGSDYGNTNQSIDAIMSNTYLADKVSVSATIKAAQPAVTPFKINFQDDVNPTENNVTANSDDDSQQLYNLRTGILMAIIMAKDSYLNKKIRPGYPQSSKDINLKQAYTDIEALYQTVEQEYNPLAALNHLTDHLTSEHACWQPYDFNSYLIDALQLIARDKTQELSNIDWHCFTPSAVKHFEGVVYRGTSSGPDKVFKKGFVDYGPSNDIKDYTQFRNLNTGVSTSRSYDLAESYTHVASRQGKSRFVYTILYRGIGAVDIVETAKAQGINLRSTTNPQAMKALEKDEINIIDNIPPQQILYATEFLEDGSEVIYKNPNYDPTYVVENIDYSASKQARTTNWFDAMYNFFADIFSYVKTLLWRIGSANQAVDYGSEKRNKEINKNPTMQKAEALFKHITNTNSFDLISAHLAVNTVGADTIQTQPENSEQIKCDNRKPKSASLEVLDEPIVVKHLRTL